MLGGGGGGVVVEQNPFVLLAELLSVSFLHLNDVFVRLHFSSLYLPDFNGFRNITLVILLFFLIRLPPELLPVLGPLKR